MSYDEYQNLMDERNKCLREAGQLPEKIGDGEGGRESQQRSAGPSGQGRTPAITSNAAPPRQNVTAQHLRQVSFTALSCKGCIKKLLYSTVNLKFSILARVIR